MSRANYGRLKSVIQGIQSNINLKLQLILGASFYNAEVPFPVVARIQCLLNSDDNEGMALTTGILLQQITHEFQRLKPDIVLVHGDRYEMLACAIAASYLNIPLAHTEGGEQSGCIDDKVRNAISQLADIHLVTTTASAQRLNKPNTRIVGSPALDILTTCDLSHIDTMPYFLILCHPITTKSENIDPLIDALKCFDIRKIWINPNVDAGNKQILKKIHTQDVTFMKDLPPEDYYRLLNNCKCAIGNSSSFIKEGSYLGSPVVLIGDRQIHRETWSNVVFANNNKHDIVKKIQYQLTQNQIKSSLFGDGTAGEKITAILAKVEL